MAQVIDQEYDSDFNLIEITVEDNGKYIHLERVRQGKWMRNDLGETYCSKCHSRIPYVQCYDFYPDCCKDDEDMQWVEEIERTNYCPNCGAKMDLEA